jgi:hypothetical protein
MFTHGVELDVLDDDHFIGVSLEQGVVDDLVDILGVALGQEPHRFGGAGRGVHQSLTERVFPHHFE